MPTLYWGPWLAKICQGGPEHDLRNILILLPFKAIYFRSLHYETPSMCLIYTVQ